MLLAYMAVILQAVIIGFSFLFVKTGLDGADAWDLLAWRFAAAAPPALFLMASGKVAIRVSGKDLSALLPLALLYPALFFSLQTLGMQYLGSAESGVFLASVPIFTLVLGGVFLGERASAWQKVCVAATVGGVIFISLMGGVRGGGYGLAGTVLTLAATLSLAFYNILARNRLRSYPALGVTCVMIVFAFLVFGAIALVKHAFLGTAGGLFVPLRDWKFVWTVLYLGVLSSFCTAFLLNYALARLEAYKISVFGNLSTVIALWAGHFFLEERLQWYHLLGAAVIVAGVVGTGYAGRNAKRPPAVPEPPDNGKRPA